MTPERMLTNQTDLQRAISARLTAAWGNVTFVALDGGWGRFGTLRLGEHELQTVQGSVVERSGIHRLLDRQE